MEIRETYFGMIRTPADAIKLFEACRLGILPRVQRRLSEKERQQIRPGSVFVWDEVESGIRRWTDGKSWSASRVSGSFLTYREMEGKRGGFSAPRRPSARTPDATRFGEEEDHDQEGYGYKVDGLMKQSFSITTQSGQHLHLISYYTRNGNDKLLTPSTDPNLKHVVPPKGIYPESTWNDGSYTPHMNRTPMSQPYTPSVGQGQHPSPQYTVQPHAWPPSPVATPPYNFSQNHHYGGPPPIGYPPAQQQTPTLPSPYASHPTAGYERPMMPPQTQAHPPIYANQYQLQDPYHPTSQVSTITDPYAMPQYSGDHRTTDPYQLIDHAQGAAYRNALPRLATEHPAHGYDALSPPDSGYGPSGGQTPSSGKVSLSSLLHPDTQQHPHLQQHHHPQQQSFVDGMNENGNGSPSQFGQDSAQDVRAIELLNREFRF